MANMRKIVSPTSSETSETQSVDDNNLSGSGNQTPPINSSNNRNPKNWKRMKDSSNADKESEAKRPPWRAVSVSTLPKPDKNALLRAKLLDASRRLRAGKCTIGIQTDLEPTKMMKDLALNTQTDLILYKDVGSMTDGSYAKRKHMLDEFILTYSVAQMTEGVKSNDVATQTLLPKVSGDEFLAAYADPNYEPKDELKFSNIELQLLQQIRKIREFKAAQHIDLGDLDAHKSTLLTPTLDAWNFAGNEQAYIMDTRGRERFVLPFPIGIEGNTNYYNLKLLFLAVDELIHESNGLVNFIQKTQLNGGTREKELQEILNFQPAPLNLPSYYWNGLIETQEKELQELLKDVEKK